MDRPYTVFLVVLAIFCFCASDALATTDEQRLAVWRQPVEAAVKSYTPCPHVTYILHADQTILRAFPDRSVSAMADGNLVGGTGWEGHVCTVWMSDDLGSKFRRVLTHEILHTAGWVHSHAMKLKIRDIVMRPRLAPNTNERLGRLRYPD